MQFKAMWLLAILRLSNLDIFKRNNAPRLLIRCVFKIVEAIIVQDEPTPLPAFYSTTLLPKPALFVGIEKSVHQVVAIVLRNLEWLSFDAFIQALKIKQKS